MTTKTLGIDRNLVLKSELIWWLFTGVAVLVVMLPILTNVDNYPFLFWNILYIVCSITFIRHIFLLKFTFIALNPVIKTILILASPICIWLLMDGINIFIVYLDEEGVNSFMPNVIASKQVVLGKFIRFQMLLFGVTTVIAAIVLPFRLLISIWRVRNSNSI